MNRPRPCWAPPAVRPAVASQLIREFIYLYGAVSPMDGACAFLILPAADTECFQIFLDTLGKRFCRQHILLILDGAPNHTTDDLLIPANITLEFLPPCSPELYEAHFNMCQFSRKCGFGAQSLIFCAT